ncbi:MAG: hypothetical protein JST84_07310 [Acidobacteria bacterium]|nr:hypothetical protein [Acidobacteriota bacterium]
MFDELSENRAGELLALHLQRRVNMPTKSTGKKTAQGKKSETPPKEKKAAIKGRRISDDGGGESKNASATGS